MTTLKPGLLAYCRYCKTPYNDCVFLIENKGEEPAAYFDFMEGPAYACYKCLKGETMQLENMTALTLRYLLRHKDEYPQDYIEAAEVELMQRKLMGKL